MVISEEAKTKTLNSKQDVVDYLLKDKNNPKVPKHSQGAGFAPANIALCKYWGKRNSELNLPVTNSLSLSLGNLGAKTVIVDSRLRGNDGCFKDTIFVNGKVLDENTSFYKRITAFLDLFRKDDTTCFEVETTVNIPISAGLASSSAGYAALVLALNELYGWELKKEELSILARLGSGSACRSLWNGFVEWEKGTSLNGLDCVGKPLNMFWENLRIGLLILDDSQKEISSREAMERTVQTSPLYPAWEDIVQEDLAKLKTAIGNQDFKLLGETTEANALCMHALMMTSRPSIIYSREDTLKAMNTIWDCRKNGLNVYFTQDAGPNLKLLYLAKNAEEVRNVFPSVQEVSPFEESHYRPEDF